MDLGCLLSKNLPVLFMIRFSLACFFVVASMTNTLLAQKVQGFGLMVNAGVSQGSASQNNLYTETAMISTSGGFYKIVNFRRDTLNRMINYLKFSLNVFSERKGFFEVNTSVAKISSRFIDFDILLPVRFRLSQSMDIYVGAGPVASFLLEQDVEWDGVEEQVNEQTVQFGVVGEMGLLTTGSTSIGFRMFNGFSDYPFTQVTVFVGIGFQDIYNSRKRK